VGGTTIIEHHIENLMLAGIPSRAAWNFSVAMTTRGGSGIVLASLAYSVGIISQHSGF
jgi:hypothetical protein